MDLAVRIAEIIEPTVEDLGYELVRVRLTGSRQVTLQIMADRLDGAPMTVDDCADISHAVSALLDVEDPIAEGYTLEVSSPGIDRPLTKPKHFDRFAGFEAKVEMHHMIDGRKRFNGRLEGMEDGAIILLQDGGRAALPFADMRSAKLVLTDELIEAARNGALAGAAAEGAEMDVDMPETEEAGTEKIR